MTSAEMLQKLRTLLDETPESFWDDDIDCYPALSNGQTEYASLVLAQYKAKRLLNPSEPLPESLRVLYNESTQNTTDIFLLYPLNYMYDISVYIAGNYNRPFYRRNLSSGLQFEKANSIIGTSGYFYSLSGTHINLEIETPSEAIDITLGYLIYPTAISSDNEPVLPDFSHNAIVSYAYAELLKKAGLINESITTFNEFVQEVKYS